MEDNKVIADSLRLVKNINQSLSPSDKWAIVNIAISDKNIFSFPEFPTISQVFGYSLERTIPFLGQEGVIEEKQSGVWFIKLTDIESDYGLNIDKVADVDDSIGTTALFNGYITGRDVVQYNYLANGEKFGFRMSGQYVVLVNRHKLINFIGWFSNLTPKFNAKTGVFEYLGEKVEFIGEVEIKSLQLLLDNINSLVSKKAFYGVRGKDDYGLIAKRDGITKTNDALEKVFKKIKDKIESNKKLKGVIIFVQKDGFGMFIDKNKIVKNFS